MSPDRTYVPGGGGIESLTESWFDCLFAVSEWVTLPTATAALLSKPDEAEVVALLKLWSGVEVKEASMESARRRLMSLKSLNGFSSLSLKVSR